MVAGLPAKASIVSKRTEAYLDCGLLLFKVVLKPQAAFHIPCQYCKAATLPQAGRPVRNLAQQFKPVAKEVGL